MNTGENPRRYHKRTAEILREIERDELRAEITSEKLRRRALREATRNNGSADQFPYTATVDDIQKPRP